VTQSQLYLLLITGAGIMALVTAAFLLLLRGARDQEIAYRIAGLRQSTEVKRARPSRSWSVVTYLVWYVGNALRDRMLSPHDRETLAKSMAASGFEPAKAIPIFMGAKVACLLGVPALVYLGSVLLGYPPGKQALYSVISLAVAIMLPNWVMALIRRPYQEMLRRGLPDALDLMVVCAEAGLGLGSTVERVAAEMSKSNRAVAVEFSLFTHEMRIMPDRRIALANLAERTGQPALKRLAGTLAQTLKYGTPLSQGLRTLAGEMRNERMIQFEERASRLPALLVMPMIFFILPCLFIILMGQPVSQLMGTLGRLQH
jgi:tight adherence protein C